MNSDNKKARTVKWSTVWAGCYSYSLFTRKHFTWYISIEFFQCLLRKKRSCDQYKKKTGKLVAKQKIIKLITFNTSCLLKADWIYLYLLLVCFCLFTWVRNPQHGPDTQLVCGQSDHYQSRRLNWWLIQRKPVTRLPIMT